MQAETHDTDILEIFKTLNDICLIATESEIREILTYLTSLNPSHEIQEKYKEMILVLKERIIELERKVRPGNDQFEKYCCNADTVMTMLENYGVAIIPSVLTSLECEEMLNGMWSFLEHITSQMQIPIKKNDEKTWSTFYELFTLHSMLMQHWQVGHAQFVWDLRQNRKIVDIFARIWNVKPEDLIVSFDGAAFHMPSEVTNRGYYRGNKWFHTDQNLLDPTFCCVQSWVTGLEVRPGDATLTFLEGSHKLHGEFAKTVAVKDKKDWYKLTEKETQWFEAKGCHAMNIACPPGSLVLWDSRTMHAGKEALKDRLQRNFRCVVYLCYTPKNLLTAANRKKKVKAFNEMRMTSHWPHKVKLFPVMPRTYGQQLPQIPEILPPILNELGKTLAGL